MSPDNDTYRDYGIAHISEVPCVTAVFTASDGESGIRVFDVKGSLAILSAALILACRDGWADAEGAQRSYLKRAHDWICDES